MINNLEVNSLFDRIASMVKTSLADDPNISIELNTYYDSTSFVITDASPGRYGADWDDQDPINLINSVYNLFDDRPETFAVMVGENATYVEFDAGYPIKLIGFKYTPRPLTDDDALSTGGIPGYGYISPVTRLKGKLSLADDWVTFATLTLDPLPTTADAIEKLMLFAATYRFFRVEFVPPPEIGGTTRVAAFISSMQLIEKKR